MKHSLILEAMWGLMLIAGMVFVGLYTVIEAVKLLVWMGQYTWP